MTSGNSKEAFTTLKVLTKTQQYKSSVIEDKGGNILTESTSVLNRWTEYCSGQIQLELHPNTIQYNYELHSDTVQSNQIPAPEDESVHVLTEEAGEVVRSLKSGKSPGVDNFSSKLLENGGEATTTVLTAIYQKTWETKNGRKSIHNRSSYLYQRNATSRSVRTIVPSA